MTMFDGRLGLAIPSFMVFLAMFLAREVPGQWPTLTSYPSVAVSNESFTLICSTTETRIWYINWKRNNHDIFGVGPDTGIAGTSRRFSELQKRIVYNMTPGKQYNVTLSYIDPEVDHGSFWTCRVKGQDSNLVEIIVEGYNSPNEDTQSDVTNVTTPFTPLNSSAQILNLPATVSTSLDDATASSTTETPSLWPSTSSANSEGTLTNATATLSGDDAMSSTFTRELVIAEKTLSKLLPSAISASPSTQSPLLDVISTMGLNLSYSETIDPALAPTASSNVMSVSLLSSTVESEIITSSPLVIIQTPRLPVESVTVFYDDPVSVIATTITTSKTSTLPTIGHMELTTDHGKPTVDHGKPTTEHPKPTHDHERPTEHSGATTDSRIHEDSSSHQPSPSNPKTTVRDELPPSKDDTANTPATEQVKASSSTDDIAAASGITSVDKGVLAAAGIGGVIVLILVGFCIAGAVRKRRKERGSYYY